MNDIKTIYDAIVKRKSAGGAQTVNFHYLALNKEQADTLNVAVRNFFANTYGVEYASKFSSNSFTFKIFSEAGAKEEFEIGENLKNVVFYPLYTDIQDGVMDPDYPNCYMMEDLVDIHEIPVSDTKGKKIYICKVSNKRLVCLLTTIDYGSNTGIDQIPTEEVDVLHSRYAKAPMYGMYVIYDLKVDRIIDGPNTR